MCALDDEVSTFMFMNNDIFCDLATNYAYTCIDQVNCNQYDPSDTGVNGTDAFALVWTQITDLTDKFFIMLDKDSENYEEKMCYEWTEATATDFEGSF
jgi:hypothetical protein